MARQFLFASSQDMRFGVDATTGLDLSGTDWSFSAWVNVFSYTASHRGLLGTFISDQMYGVSFINGLLSVHVINVSDSSANATTNPALNVWTHVGATVGAASPYAIAYYTAGVAAGTAQMGVGNGPTPGRFTNAIGLRQNDMWFNGRIAEVAIWTTQLSSGNFATLAAGAAADEVNSTDLALYIPTCGIDSPEPDLGPNNLDATLTNSPVYAPHPPVVTTCTAAPIAWHVA